LIGSGKQSDAGSPLDAAAEFLKHSCFVEIISLTPRFNAVNHERAQKKPFRAFSKIL
jgi:hypothetical protein